ncbi:MAG: succinylglutamate desuccinylase/aspartoacylase family protein, partial [Patescibacteria group bacterium]
MKINRKIQIGVMGSSADLKYTKQLQKVAEEVGYWIAKRGATLIFGAEKDYDSLSSAACRAASRFGGLAVGVTYDQGLGIYEKTASVIIATGVGRGGGREFSLVSSCDVIITIGGGSGTLTEMAIAYQLNIPIVSLLKTGGWSSRLAGKYLDERSRLRCEPAKNARAAVDLAIKLAQQKLFNKKKDVLFLTAVHGNEKLGIDVMKRLDKEVEGVNYDWVVANERAEKKSVRFTEVDLNRSAPGKKQGSQYEIRRAYELTQLAKNYRFVIDIHGASDNCGIFTIVNNPKIENLYLANSLPVERVVIWSSANSKKSGPMTQFVDCGVEIECGPKNSTQVKNKLFEIVKQIVCAK